MKVFILRGVRANNQSWRPGQVVSLDYQSAQELIALGKAEAYVEREPLVNRAEGLSEEEAPKIQKRRGRPRLKRPE